jgi:copper(I)-binding protein
MPEGNRRGTRIARWTAAIAGVTVAAMALGGCGQHRAAVAPIRIASAYVMQSSGLNAQSAYLVISNNGSADRLLSVRSSAGGQVFFVAPRASGPAAASALSALAIPGHAITRLDPSGVHLEIVHSGRLREGTDVTLTLVFAHAGTMHVLAQVNNPATNDGGYFGP